jgi:hypothetical protein
MRFRGFFRDRAIGRASIWRNFSLPGFRPQAAARRPSSMQGRHCSAAASSLELGEESDPSPTTHSSSQPFGEPYPLHGLPGSPISYLGVAWG